MPPATFPVVVAQLAQEAPSVLRLELRPEAGLLPPFTAGAHVDLHVGSGLTRSYSLLNDPEERHRYVIAVHREPRSRGGSAWIHERLRAGDRIRISAPRNHFNLNEAAPHSVLIAGGIGITPLLSMVRRLIRLGRDWTLHYAFRSRASAGLLPELRALGTAWPGRVHLHADDEMGRPLDLAAITSAAPADTHLYCCGPTGMLDAFQALTALRDPGTVHLERFSAAAVSTTATPSEFTVVLARTGREIAIARDTTILDALLDDGIEIPCSCLEGTCGSCEAAVLEGIPDHRDVVLTSAERAANDRMLVCCSRSLTPRLVLDL